VKILATGQKQSRKFPSGPKLTPKQMVAGVKKLAKDWKYNAVSIGYPGVVIRNRPVADPYNLGRGWAGFDFGAAFKCPVKVINDAAMQALGSYKHGKRCSSSGWVPGSVPPWWWMASWNRWGSGTSRTRRD